MLSSLKYTLCEGIDFINIDKFNDSSINGEITCPKKPDDAILTAAIEIAPLVEYQEDNYQILDMDQ